MNKAALNYLQAFPFPNNGPEQGNNTLTNNYISDPQEIHGKKGVLPQQALYR